MDMHEDAAVVERGARYPVRARFGFMAMLLSLLVFVSGSAHADPATANIYLQTTKNDFNLTKTYYQIGRNYAVSVNSAVARSYFNYAYSNSIVFQIDAARLHSENVLNLQNGLYRNLNYQQLAVQNSNLLSVQIQLLSAYLSILSQQPLNANARASVDAQLVQISITLYYVDSYMRLAQT